MMARSQPRIPGGMLTSGRGTCSTSDTIGITVPFDGAVHLAHDEPHVPAPCPQHIALNPLAVVDGSRTRRFRFSNRVRPYDADTEGVSFEIEALGGGTLSDSAPSTPDSDPLRAVVGGRQIHLTRV